MEEDFLEEIQKNEHSTLPDSERVLGSAFVFRLVLGVFMEVIK